MSQLEIQIQNVMKIAERFSTQPRQNDDEITVPIGIVVSDGRLTTSSTTCRGCRQVIASREIQRQRRYVNNAGKGIGRLNGMTSAELIGIDDATIGID